MEFEPLTPPLRYLQAATAYVMLGIDEIGIQIEQPFDVLPLHGLATVLTRDVADELLCVDQEDEQQRIP